MLNTCYNKVSIKELTKMDEEFINDFIIDLNTKIDNRRYTSQLRENIHDLDESKLKDLIKSNF